MAADLILPPFNGWMLPDDGIEILVNLIDEHRPGLILECGSGRSTVMLAAALRELDNGYLISLEHQESFCEETEGFILRNDLGAYAHTVYAPLEPHGQEEIFLEGQWYARSAWDYCHDVSFLFVDGPPGNLAPFSRAPALPLLRDRLLPDCVIALDDTCRRAERRIVREWGIEMTYVPHSTGALSFGTIS